MSQAHNRFRRRNAGKEPFGDGVRLLQMRLPEHCHYPAPGNKSRTALDRCSFFPTNPLGNGRVVAAGGTVKRAPTGEGALLVAAALCRR
jgi:hypothetical protein